MAGPEPIEINLRYSQGNTIPFGFTLKDSSGAAIDVSTGYSWRLAISKEPDPEDAAGQLFELIGALTSGGADGKFQFAPTAAQSNQTPAVYYYGVRQVGPTGVHDIVKGSFRFLASIVK